MQWKALKEGKMLRFHFWCTTDRSYLWRVLFNHGLEVLKHTAVREGNRVLPRRQRRPCSWVFCCYLCPGPLRVDTSRWTELPLSVEVSTPWVLSEFGLSALTALISLPSVCTPPSQLHSQLKPMLHPTLCLPKLSSTLLTPSWAPHSAPSSLIFWAHSMTPFELHFFSLNHLHNPDKIIHLFTVLAVPHLNRGTWALQSCLGYAGWVASVIS